jgi:DNA polymerase-3 subunit alpha
MYSLLDGLSKPVDIAQRIANLELDGCAISDHGNVTASVQFHKAMQAKKLKSIQGCELYLSNGPCTDKTPSNRKLFHQVVLAKNLQGWKSLIKMTSDSNSPDRLYYRPRLDYKYFEEHKPEGIITFSGHLGSRLANIAQTGTKQDVIREAEYLRDLFGKENFFIEIQLIDSALNDDARIVGEILREVAIATGIDRVATADSHYCTKQDSDDQKVLLCTNLRTTLAQIQRSIKDEEEVGLGCFFKSNNFHIPSYDEMKQFHTDEELQNTVRIADMVEDYSMLGKPILPPFDCPGGSSPAEYLRHLCREGWKKKIATKIPKEQHQTYADRVKYELEVLQGADLSSYFLIVRDIIDYAKSNNWLVGPGRGSAAGCLVSYLINITAINPIPYDLLFERFYNAGRNTKDRVSYPDIDVDIPKEKREDVIEYIKNKYGHDRVAQMSTYQTMKGRSAFKDVCRAHGGITNEELNSITKFIPDEAAIADDLQEMREDTGESSIIRWALENNSKELKDWCYIDKDGSLDGPLAKRFEQAITLEGTKTAQSKHASGIVIAPQSLNDMCPMILDSKSKDKSLIAGLEMNDLEALGIIKLDILGLNMLDKIMGIQQILETGDIYA